MTVAEVADAAFALAGEGLGALIVLERSVDLQDVLDTGQPIWGVVSRNLLVSLFQRTSYLHDGAAVLRGDKVAAAACVLPLSLREDVPRGLRHRAARGVTETSDALAVVVSEETGQVRLGVGGLLEGPFASPRDLDARLRALLAAPRVAPGRGAGVPGRVWRRARAVAGTVVEVLETVAALVRRLFARTDERLAWEDLRAAGRGALQRNDAEEAELLLLCAVEKAVEIGDRGLVVATLDSLGDLVALHHLRARHDAAARLVRRVRRVTARLDPGVLWAQRMEGLR